MTATLKALKTELTKLQKLIASIEEIIDANPLGRIIELRKEAAGIMEEHKGDHSTIAKLIEPLAKEEKKMFALSKKQLNPKWIDQLVKLKSDESNLINSIYYEERKAI